MAVKITCDHSGPLNVRATFTLNGVHKGSAKDLIELLRSDETIDRQTRDAMANALERQTGVRLEFHQSNKAAFSRTETMLKHQQIADEFERLRAEGLSKQKAYQSLIDRDIAKSDRAIDLARNKAREALFRVKRVRKEL